MNKPGDKVLNIHTFKSFCHRCHNLINWTPDPLAEAEVIQVPAYCSVCLGVIKEEEKKMLKLGKIFSSLIIGMFLWTFTHTTEAEIRKRQTSYQTELNPRVCTKAGHMLKDKECAVVIFNFEQLQDVRINKPGNNVNACSKGYSFDVSEEVNNVCRVGGGGVTGPRGPTGPTGPRGPTGPTGPAGPSSGISTFLGLSDTPDSYDTAGEIPIVNNSRTGLVFGALGFTALNDTPNSIQAGKFLKGKSDSTGIEWTDAPSGGGGDGRLIAQETTPTDLSNYAHGQVLPINTPSPGKWIEISGADTGELHSFSMDSVASSLNPAQNTWVVGTDLNYGYSSFGTVFGDLYTEDRGLPFTPSNTPIMRVQLGREVIRVPVGQSGSFGFTSNLTILIRKTELTSAPTTLFIRFYSGIPSNDNELATAELRKGADNPAHTLSHIS